MGALRLIVIAAVAAAGVLIGQPARAAEPLDLAPGVHPFIDRALVASTSGVVHTLHEPLRREVVLAMDKPWEGIMSGYGMVMRDPENRIRLYYRGGGDIDPPEVTCVAFSDDGASFTRPNLGLYEVRGTRDNNVVFTADRPSYGESHNFAPFFDANSATSDSARWKAVALRVAEDDTGERRRMLTVLGSPDGLRWKHLADKPVIRDGAFDSLNVAFFHPASGKYLCYYRVGRNGLRSIARAESIDFLSWTTSALAFRPDQDEQWYTNGVAPYPGDGRLLLALPMRFVPERKSVGSPPRGTDGLSDAVLLTSRDGLAWDRTFREAFIRPGPDPDNWGDAHGNNTPLAGIIETAPGEWSVYWYEGYGSKTPRIRRGAMRAHGFASLRAGADDGEFVTPPIRLPAEATSASLALNCATSARGSIRVEILGPDGGPIPGYSAADCGEIYGDEPARAVQWKGGSALPARGEFRLRFILRDADLFALVVNP